MKSKDREMKVSSLRPPSVTLCLSVQGEWTQTLRRQQLESSDRRPMATDPEANGSIRQPQTESLLNRNWSDLIHCVCCVWRAVYLTESEPEKAAGATRGWKIV